MAAQEDSKVTSIVERVLGGGGEMGRLMRAFDWSQTPLGPVEKWPQSLRSAVSILLPSKAQICLFWGSEFTVLYNDAYRPTFAEKHPGALGTPGRKSWSEIWDVLGGLFQQVISTGEAFWAKDYQFLLNRRGFIEETYYDVSYDPVRDETGDVGGIFCIVSETTGRVLGERRLGILRELGALISEGKTREETCALAAHTLADKAADVPFALIYLLDDSGEKARLAGHVGVEPGSTVSPYEIELAAASGMGSWPLQEVYLSGERAIVADLYHRFDDLPPGIWPEAPHTALVLPLLSAGKCAGFLIAGVSPRLLLDEQYEGFFGLVAGHIEKAIDHARAYEIERERAETLAELDRAKTAFFSNISHEFRTPLTLILDPINDLLSSEGLNEQQRQSLRLMQRNGLRLLKLVNSLLDFSRIEAGRADVSFEPTDLAAYTADLASMFRAAVEKAGLNLIVDCEPLPEPIYVDREMWEKIVLNLVSNAFKFTFKGTITVTLRAVGDHVELSVRDTGVGIPAAEQSHIFDRFHRVRGTRSRTHEGTGIGLALIRDLVHLHRGSITVESAVDQGTTFMVSIPMGKAHLPPEQIQAARSLVSTSIGALPYVENALRWLDMPKVATSEVQALIQLEDGVPAKAAISLNGTGSRILLVDDNADMRDYLSHLLATHFTVAAYGDGLSALEAARREPPDLILSDIMMPGLDGFELLRALRSDPATRTVPIILLSARAGEEATVEGLEAGADDYLIKPFSSRELLARVSAQLEMSALREEIMTRERVLRSQAEAERQRAISILESISDSFITLDREYCYQYLNPQADQLLEKLSGLTSRELLGHSVWEMFPGSYDSPFGHAYRRAMEEGVTLHIEDYFGPLNTWFAAHIYPSENGLAIYFADITARKQSEDQIRQQAAQIAVMDERQRIARELHDAVNQLLFSASIIVESLPRLWERQPEAMPDKLKMLGRLTRGAMAEMRTLLLELRPDSQHNARLSDLLAQLADVVLGSTTLEVSLTANDDGPKAVPFDVRFAFYRIAQEALNNVVKHAQARHIDIRLTCKRGLVEMRIRDDGRGFDPHSPSVGIGLQSMRERAKTIGAILEVESEIGEGTDVVLHWSAG